MTRSVAVTGLRPGDVVTGPGATSATFVQQAEHPIWRHLRLVIWKMADGSWSHDALDARQVVGTVEETTPDDRQAALRRALLHRSMW